MTSAPSLAAAKRLRVGVLRPPLPTAGDEAGLAATDVVLLPVWGVGAPERRAAGLGLTDAAAELGLTTVDFTVAAAGLGLADADCDTDLRLERRPGALGLAARLRLGGLCL